MTDEPQTECMWCGSRDDSVYFDDEYRCPECHVPVEFIDTETGYETGYNWNKP